MLGNLIQLPNMRVRLQVVRRTTVFAVHLGRAWGSAALALVTAFAVTLTLAVALPSAARAQGAEAANATSASTVLPNVSASAAKAAALEERVADLEAYVNNGARVAKDSKVPGPGPGHNAWMMVSARQWAEPDRQGSGRQPGLPRADFFRYCLFALSTMLPAHLILTVALFWLGR
jgi:hypothetical protein